MNKIGRTSLILLSSFFFITACGSKEKTENTTEQPAAEQVTDVFDDNAYIIELTNIIQLLDQYHALNTEITSEADNESSAEVAREDAQVYLDSIDKAIIEFQESKVASRKYAATLELTDDFLNETLVWIRANNDPDMSEESLQLLEDSYAETSRKFNEEFEHVVSKENS